MRPEPTSRASSTRYWKRIRPMHSAPRAFTSRLPTDRSPSPLLDISTTATGLLCWRDSHPLEWQLASLHQIVPWSTLCRADWVRNDPVLTTRGWLLRHYDPVSP